MRVVIGADHAGKPPVQVALNWLISKGVVPIPGAKTERIVDPTGCGDAYRGGLLYGLMNDMDWENTGRVAALMGAIKIESHGTQNHSFTKDEFIDRFKDTFGYCL